MSKYKLLIPIFLFGSTNTKIQEVNTLKKFEEAIIQDNLPSILLFESPNCPACKAMVPVFKQAAKKYGRSANFIDVDATKEELKPIVDHYGVNGVPTIYYKEVGFKQEADFNKTVECFLGISKKPKAVKPAPKTIKQVKKKKVLKK